MYSLYTIILKACIKSIFKHEKRVVSWINVKQKNILKEFDDTLGSKNYKEGKSFKDKIKRFFQKFEG